MQERCLATAHGSWCPSVFLCLFFLHVFPQRIFLAIGNHLCCAKVNPHENHCWTKPRDGKVKTARNRILSELGMEMGGGRR